VDVQNWKEYCENFMNSIYLTIYKSPILW